MTDTKDTTYYSYTRGLDGHLVPPDQVRQSGRLVPRYVPESRHEVRSGTLADFLSTYRTVTYSLNKVERRIWMALLRKTHTPREIAAELGITAQAVYGRLRGNKGRGGMIRKNCFVLAWWLTQRNRSNQHG